MENHSTESERGARRGVNNYKRHSDDPKESMAKAYLTGHYTLLEVADDFGVSYATVSRAVKKYEEK